eukprot:TRINITY_DN5211_c0_g1_i2.p1 TRINITY_DN5211_c0_g1~~TRINITY_DN5211_c0_g1_i2.p1  ORF type:complete len:494 (+),score=64.23 TRINITY_DN5211_c0_g1_i2:28-1482(+)
MRANGMLAKFKHVLFNWVLLSIMLVGIVYVLHLLLSSFLSEATPNYLSFSYALIGIGGSIGGMMCITRGFTVLVQWEWISSTTTAAPVRATLSVRQWREGCELLKIKKEAIEYQKKLLEMKNDSLFLPDVTLEQLEIEERRLQEETQNFTRLNRLYSSLPDPSTKNENIMWKIIRYFYKISVGLLFFSLFLFRKGMEWARSIARHAYKLFNILLPALIVLRTTLGLFVNIIWGPDKGVFNFLNPDPEHYMGPISTLIDFLLVIYITVASFFGYFNISLLREIRPVAQDTSLANLLLNTFLLLGITSSLPLIANILGLIHFSLISDFDKPYLKNSYLIVTYKITFLIFFIQRYTTFFPVVPILKRWLELCGDPHLKLVALWHRYSQELNKPRYPYPSSALKNQVSEVSLNRSSSSKVQPKDAVQAPRALKKVRRPYALKPQASEVNLSRVVRPSICLDRASHPPILVTHDHVSPKRGSRPSFHLP